MIIPSPKEIGAQFHHQPQLLPSAASLEREKSVAAKLSENLPNVKSELPGLGFDLPSRPNLAG